MVKRILETELDWIVLQIDFDGGDGKEPRTYPAIALVNESTRQIEQVVQFDEL